MNERIRDGDLNITLPVAEGGLNIAQAAEGGVIMRVREPLPAYTGEVVVTPSRETQTLSTKQLTMLSDITINPIPQNYGLITWNGSTITVS